MSGAEIYWLVLGLIIIGGLLLIRRVFGMHKRGLAYSQEAIDGMNKRLALDEEILAQNKRLVEQGDETIALLQAIRDQLEHRSIKN